MLSAVWGTFCGINNPQFNTSKLDDVDIFENILIAATMQLIVNDTNKSFQL
jgi:hypothetical protein